MNVSHARSNLGLSTLVAEQRAREFGPNLLPEKQPLTLWQRFINQFRSPLIYILLAALAVDLAIWLSEGATGIPVESVAIALILLVNAALGVYQEAKAESALARLKALAKSLVWVIRDGRMVHLPSADLVPGDVVRLEAGDRIPADGKLIDAEGLMVDESILTGESVPLDKTQADEVFSATLLTRGKGYMEVTRTGVESTAGNLATMIGAIEADQTPLERRLAVFGRQIARWILVLACGFAISGLLIEGLARFGHVLLFAVALAVAAVPEGLPAVSTLALALGVERMAREKAVVRRLSAVEALGSVTVIASDKTGTLTENKLQVKDLDCFDTSRTLRAMVLANDAEFGADAGDPLEVALLDYAAEQSPDISAMLDSQVRHSARPFDSAYRFMRVTVVEEGRLVSYLKGAPEVLLSQSKLSAEEFRSWSEKAEAYAAEGFRVLGFAWRDGEAENDLIFLGLALLWDPPRPEVAAAIQSARAAGIRIVMVTGDHPATALAVAMEIGISPGRVLTGLDLNTLSDAELRSALRETSVFARVAPEDKLRLVEALKASGEIVAVTGDGVNDAPALKRSDIGIAMGRRGSDVAREVADLVLLDDNFATIVAAIREGRNIYENIQKFIRFLFSTNFAEILIVVSGAIGSFFLGLHDETGQLFLPLTAAQLLWVNIVTDGPPALALALDRDPSVLEQKPRDPKSPLLDRSSLHFVVATGTFKALVGGAMLLLLPFFGYSLGATRTLLFLYMAIGQLVFAYPARRIATAPKQNFVLHGAVIGGIAIQILTVEVPALRVLLGLITPTFAGMIWVTGGVLLSWAMAESYAWLAAWRARPKPSMYAA